MDKQQLQNKLKLLKNQIMEVLTLVTVIEYELDKLTLKIQESPPRKKKSNSNGATSTSSFRMPQARDRKIKKRIQPVPTHNTNSNIPTDKEKINWKKEEEQWFMRRKNDRMRVSMR